MNTITQSNKLAGDIINNDKHRYLYGGKDDLYTSELVNGLAKRYPTTFTSTLKALALKDADKGYYALDCSGFVCKVLGLNVGAMGSANMYQTAVKKLAITKSNAKSGMAIWKSGHVAYVGEDLNIYEAASTATDMKVSKWEDRAKDFKYLLIIKGSALAIEYEESKKASNPYNKPDGTVLLCTYATGKRNKYKNFVYRDTSAKSIVKWVQFELNAAGCVGKDKKELTVDGILGANSDYAIRAFQSSCKITVDGVVGKNTINKLIEK